MSWKSVPIMVEGRQFTFADVRNGRGERSSLFHGSIHEIAVGKFLRPGVKPASFKESPASTVCLTSDLDRAALWARDAGGDDEVWVYEVEPVGHVELHRVSLSAYGKGFTMWEGRVQSARVVAAHRVGKKSSLLAIS